MMYDPGDVILAEIPYPDSSGSKKRPALILFKERNNFVVAGITSKLSRKGIKFLPSEGIMKESVLLLNYIFTISRKLINRVLFTVSEEKRKIIYDQLIQKLEQFAK